jgi:RNA polymerase sigma factor (sigma-70 family)
VDIDAQLAGKRDVIERTARAFIRRTGWIEYDDAVQVVTLEAWRILQDAPADGAVDGLIIVRGFRRLSDELRSGQVTGITRSDRKHGVEKEMSLNVRVAGDRDGRELIETLVDESPDEYERVDHEDWCGMTCGTALAVLPERERLFVWLHYFEGLDQQEIGEMHGISGSRVSQLLAKALSRMRPVLAAA